MALEIQNEIYESDDVTFDCSSGLKTRAKPDEVQWLSLRVANSVTP